MSMTHALLCCVLRYNYVTPTSYLELLTTFIKLLAEKRKEINETKRRLEVGPATSWRCCLAKWMTGAALEPISSAIVQPSQ